jgi:transcriptional regulator with XRE-family HTH domain
MLKAARERANLSQQDVGRHFGISDKTISAWEKGIGDPGIYRLRDIAKLYGVAADALLWENSLTPEAMKFAAEYDSLTEQQKASFSVVWLAFNAQSVSDEDVEKKMPITRKEQEHHR